MKKVAALGMSALSFVTTATSALAQPATPTPTPGKGVRVAITPPGGFVSAQIDEIIGNVLIIVFSAATLLVLVFLIIGAFQWITSGGDKEAVGKARSRITAALVGLLILALAFVIIRVVGQILGIPNILLFDFPSLEQ